MQTTTLTPDAAKFLDVAESLPIEMRIAIIDRLLETIQPQDEEIERLWIAEAERRADEIESGKVKPIPGEQVLREIREKFGL